MSGPQPNGHPDEQRLVSLYMDLTGKPESVARSVIMYVNLPQEDASRDCGNDALKPLPDDQRDTSRIN